MINVIPSVSVVKGVASKAACVALVDREMTRWALRAWRGEQWRTRRGFALRFSIVGGLREANQFLSLLTRRNVRRTHPVKTGHKNTNKMAHR